jgi:hypothetical protein
MGLFGIAVVVALVLGSLLLYLYRSTTTRSADAATATLQARQRFSDIHSHAAAIEHHQWTAGQALGRARAAYEDTLYSEFWESIEEATKALEICQNSQSAIATDIDGYVTVLDGRTHDFPLWYAGLRPLQDLTPLMRELSALKRKGDSNHQFATIREMQKIRGAIEKLGEAIRHLEVAVTTSLNDLRRAVNRSALLRAADPGQLRVVVGFLFSGSAEEGNTGG